MKSFQQTYTQKNQKFSSNSDTSSRKENISKFAFFITPTQDETLLAGLASLVLK